MHIFMLLSYIYTGAHKVGWLVIKIILIGDTIIDFINSLEGLKKILSKKDGYLKYSNECATIIID